MQRKIGILGGMGTAAGIYFAQTLVELSSAVRGDVDYPSFVLYSDPLIPSRVDAYLEGTASPLPSIISSIDKLATAGADFGVIICNTAHIYFDEIERDTTLPLINMVDNVVSYLKSGSRAEKVGLLATKATIRSGLYSRYFDGSVDVIVTPNDNDQDLVTSAIFDPEFGIKASGAVVKPQARELIVEVIRRMLRDYGVGKIVLGCTELSMAVREENLLGVEIIDPVKLLARACLRRVGHYKASSLHYI
ncbi:aspartate/glutamate racemase family protein [Massilia sp. Root335]|uniref:aspartate/glutamate racemase family protein n=1 Tax=Massilia sp. Root335 TaxID=1736517 RepID=UPI0009EBCD76|nr:amino acid racemase [Massilia sp. Root335]